MSKYAGDLILDVTRMAKDGGEWHVRCPHCNRMLGLAEGPVRGEQFFDKVCGGWLQVTFDAKAIKPEVFFADN